MTDNFYHAFEEKHRGSRELIKSRLQVYHSFIAPLLEIYADARSVDLGCGRGEWLELAAEWGFKATGVDLDSGMLAACVERKLPAKKGDAITHLKALGDESQCVVSGFHIAEHLTFSKLKTLVKEALRVLKPGGLLILETPNPENVAVGCCSFYLDPTHVKPIPPLLLSFIPEYCGFARNHIVRLQENPELHQGHDIHLADVFGSVSPDYAVIAQKLAPPEIMQSFDAPFAKKYGIELHELAQRYDMGVDNKIENTRKNLSNNSGFNMNDALNHIASIQDRLIDKATQLAHQEAAFAVARNELENANARINELEANLIATRQELDKTLQANHNHWQLAEERHQTISQLQAQIRAAESKAQQIECRVTQSESRENEARAQAQQAIEVARQAQESMQRAEARAEQAEGQLEKSEAELARAKRCLVDLQADAAKVRRELAETLQTNHNHWHLAEVRGQELTATQQQLQDVLQINQYHWQLAEQRLQRQLDLEHSWSWKVTAPLRWLSRPFAPAAPAPTQPVIALSPPQPTLTESRALPLDTAVEYVQVAAPAHKALVEEPLAIQALEVVAAEEPIVPEVAEVAAEQVVVAVPVDEPPVEPSTAAVAIDASAAVSAPAHIEAAHLDQLTPHARQIYADLQAAIARR